MSTDDPPGPRINVRLFDFMGIGEPFKRFRAAPVQAVFVGLMGLSGTMVHSKICCASK